MSGPIWFNPKSFIRTELGYNEAVPPLKKGGEGGFEPHADVAAVGTRNMDVCVECREGEGQCQVKRLSQRS